MPSAAASQFSESTGIGKLNPKEPVYDGETIDGSVCENVITARNGKFTFKVYAHRYLTYEELKQVVWEALRDGTIEEPEPGTTTTLVTSIRDD
jgi:hypothetical protein